MTRKKVRNEQLEVEHGPRELSEDETEKVTGAGTKSTYYSYYSGTSTNYSSNSDSNSGGRGDKN